MSNPDKKFYAVAIDGPSGAGKSTIAKILAKELGFLYIDTGALYRALGYAMIQKSIDLSDAEKVEAHLPELKVELRYMDGAQHIFVNGEDVTDFIRTPQISMAASHVSAIPAVRRFLFELQRNTARENNVIMDGRDIGTVVLPDADVKIFLTASAEDRARRRFEELQEKEISDSYESVLEDMKKRDYNDSHRSTAPLKAAEDAVKVDTTGNTLDKSVAVLEELIKNKLSL